MKLFIAITAVAAASLVGYYVNAEPSGPPAYAVPAPQQILQAPMQAVPYIPSMNAPVQCYGPACTVPFRSAGRMESGFMELAQEFGKSLDSAIQDRLITEEQANKLVEEFGMSMAVKKARMDLLRVTCTIDQLEKDGKGLPGWDEVRDLRKILPARETIELKTELTAKRDRHVSGVRLDDEANVKPIPARN